MAEIKDLTAIRDKYARVAPTRVTDYQEGVADPKRDWAAATKGAEDRYQQAVTQAAAEGRFGRGVSAAGTEKWSRKTKEVGVQRWSPGIQAGLQDFETGFAPFHAVIAKTTLPPRGPTGDPRNLERVAAIARALHNAKTGQ